MVSDEADFNAYAQAGYSLNPCSNGIWSLTCSSARKSLTSISLNPCSNGIWSLTWYVLLNWALWYCLNPCSNGIWSLTWSSTHILHKKVVLILVLMEYGLWLEQGVLLLALHVVLILVLMEYGLWRIKFYLWISGDNVLILVLMEYGLWLHTTCQLRPQLRRLNPCSNGIWSLTYIAPRRCYYEYRLNPCSNGIWSLTQAPHGLLLVRTWS